MIGGAELYDFARRIYPLPRSLTGNGVRQTLDAIGEWAPVEHTEVPSGTAVFDWIVPPEWNVESAWVADSRGHRIVDWTDSSLSLVGYSEPVRARLTGRELDQHLHSLPDRPDLVPYRTAYYDRSWGFCLPHSVRAEIDHDAEYDVVIDARLDPAGSLAFGECRIPGRSGGERQILVSTYICHPSLANDNVAGIAVAAALARSIKPNTLRSDVRIVFTPSGIGTLAWLQINEPQLARIHAGLLIACAGDDGPLTYKQSRRANATVDRAAAQVLAARPDSKIRPFVPWGTDERQFCSPGFDLPLGVLTRTPNAMYPEYHTSADNLDLLDPDSLADTLGAALEIVQMVDANDVFLRTEPRGEPQLSRHAIDGSMTSGLLGGDEIQKQSLFWLLNLADGRHDLLDVCERGGLPFSAVLHAATMLEAAHLLERES